MKIGGGSTISTGAGHTTKISIMRKKGKRINLGRDSVLGIQVMSGSGFLLANCFSGASLELCQAIAMRNGISSSL